MAFCTACGAQIPDDVKFCTSCGAEVKKPAQEKQNQQANTQQNNTFAPPPYQQAPYNNAVPPEGSPFSLMSVGQYIGLFFLYSLPCIGFIFLIVFCFSGTNENRKRFSRGLLFYSLIITAIGVIISLVASASIVAFITPYLDNIMNGGYSYY
ncbi:hypothetical protein SDC9_126837 [bioreactor metagenome]|uniref:Zinc-ribbon domain-containing protein n=1 Tax=bioreactor metagenome TaxID=1076179 RepID=A0A645CSC5_9ZZZZ|nr:zinc ribbon domain-containing protein [Oscillospiraceae bacterium]